jgi:NADH-quinone oxidoreductase subunit C
VADDEVEDPQVEATDGADETAGGEPEPERLHGALVGESHGQAVLFADRDQYVDVVRGLCEDGFNMCADLTAVDYLTHPDRRLPVGIAAERYEVVVSLLSMQHHRRVRVRIQVPEADAVVPSLYALYPGTEAFEREVFDMFGIRFDGHPDLTRILMPEDWDGHPLRKDYAVGRIPVEFKGAPSAR